MKLAKLSLAAIMAVGALSTANAQPLEEAIKGMDVFGYVQYEFNDSKTAEQANDYELRVGLTTPVQEDVVLHVRATGGNTFDSNSKASLGSASFDRAQITYTGIANTTVIAGRQYAGTPLEDTAAQGIKVLYSAAPGLTLAAAYFTEDSAFGNAIGAVAGIYSSKMFTARAWYIAIQDADSNTKDGSDHVFAEVGGNIAPVSLLAQYASREVNAAGSKKNSTIRVQAAADVSNFNLRVGYMTNDKDGGLVSPDASAWGDNDLIGNTWKTGTYEADANYIFGAVKTSMGKFGAELRYTDIDLPSTAVAGTTESELDAQISYQATKQLSTYVRYADMSNKRASDTNAFRFLAKYSF